VGIKQPPIFYNNFNGKPGSRLGTDVDENNTVYIISRTILYALIDQNSTYWKNFAKTHSRT